MQPQNPSRTPGQGRLARRVAFLVLALVMTLGNAHGFLKRNRPMPEPDASERDTITLVQIYLDENLFGPGKIDGKLGQFTRAALAHYNFRHGLAHDDWGRAIRESRKIIENPYTTYAVRHSDFEHIGHVPFEPAQQAEVHYLSYRSVLEFVAERYHTDERFLQDLNPGVEWPTIAPGSVIKVPNVTPFQIESVRKNQSFPKEERLSNRLVIVDTAQKIAAIWEGEAIVATFPITPGQEKFIHRGVWKLQTMVTTPEFRWDKSMLETGERSEEYYQLPPGPNSPVGIIWAGLNKKGIGLHGTALPHTIGRSRSAGCIRFANWDAIRLSSLVRPGASVEIR
ncbi:MAG: L,D-transpeptidase [Verrucomicrobiota bacterium]